MENKNFENDLNELIRTSMEIEDKPSLNFISFTLFAIFALLVISSPYIAKLIAGICLYMGTVGILITLLGVKRANLKENITVHIQKRGALV